MLLKVKIFFIGVVFIVVFIVAVVVGYRLATEVGNQTSTQRNVTTTGEIQATTEPTYHMQDCDSVQHLVGGNSGVYQIQPIGVLQPFDVYCEMTESGAWTVIQRRQSGYVGFYRNWDEYKAGFGNIDGEYWIGNDNIILTNQSSYKLRIDLEKFDGDTAYAEYDAFSVEDENSNYILHLGNCSGTAGDAMRWNDNTEADGQPFTTYDRDNDNAVHPIAGASSNCAQEYHGAWWFNSCSSAHLNGIYYPNEDYEIDSIMWKTWNNFVALKSSTMKIQDTA
ncbi:fibrinogen-like protein 1 [Saccoglossus kowalevskii]|uniref:Fibrinogen-like protein 1-like n=1 Tax=Saccoglossus kowalevskii TaxID=10224 RepID=A0ABM0GIN6_SACKO|nr:PREDICTED: fibrinogen-like protein 1-like [Saccoglossus kowalevskii]